MNNNDFLKILKTVAALGVDDARGTSKLAILHGAIANDLQKRLDNESPDKFFVYAKGRSEIKNDKVNKEQKVKGRYYAKNVDITVRVGPKENDPVVAGFELKFPMSSFNKNSNNQFENLLGNVANLRSTLKSPLYFLIIIMPTHVPVYNNGKGGLSGRVIKSMEHIGKTQLKKYGILSSDDPKVMLHTPTGQLFYNLDLPDITFNTGITTNAEYSQLFKAGNLTLHDPSDVAEFSEGAIINDYERFIERVKHAILAKGL